jgi:hypothetical protein
MYSTNYYNSFIVVAEDCPVEKAEVPALKENNKTVARLQFEMIFDNPYTHTQDDVLFAVHAIRKNISLNDTAARTEFFSKGQACLRASSLCKRYGWGVHFDADGKIALYAVDSPEYKKYMNDPKLKVYNAMRSKRK